MSLTVSVIIKTLNEEKNIAATLESILAAMQGRAGDVIVADGGSKDRTVEIASAYPVRIAQIRHPARPSCGLGPQLGYQYSRSDFVCLMDGDMHLDPGFLDDAIAYLEAHPDVAGVTGHVQEMHVSNLEFSRRVNRNAPENRIGDIDRMNGGGLYRRAAIEKAGYLSDRNLHGYEEFDLGIRLRSQGWKLHRLDRRFVQHFGHTINSYKLLVRRWKSQYLMGIGEVLRAAVGKPYFLQMIRELPELRLWALVYAWWLASLAILVLVDNKLAAIGIVLAILAAVLALVSAKKKSVHMGLYTVTAWFFHAAALPVGFFRPRLQPEAPIESELIESRTLVNAA